MCANCKTVVARKPRLTKDKRVVRWDRVCALALALLLCVGVVSGVYHAMTEPNYMTTLIAQENDL